MVSLHFSYLTTIIIILFYLSGIGLSLYAVFQSRTPQGTMAWVLALLFIPFISVPIFLIVGKKRVEDYDSIESELNGVRKKIEEQIEAHKTIVSDFPIKSFFSEGNRQFLKGNELNLLLDGEETFAEMLKCINQAKRYIFLQMYIFRTDRIGKLFAEALIKKANEGVKIYFLYECLGIRMSKDVLKKMSDAGVSLGEFSPIRLNKLQLNFRNHRKLLVIDGELGFFGGINIGDDYLGRYPEIGFWRDTNVKILGPIVYQSQIDFIKDWKFSQKNEIAVDLKDPVISGHTKVYLLNSGPSEDRPLNLLQHIELFHSAKERLWIANPYIVPPQGIIDALLVACMRGVDIRILVPGTSDNRFVALAMEVYLERLLMSGIRIYKYNRGMMHQKVLLIDEKIAVIGSSNIDYRSMYINFENAIVTDDPSFIKDLELALRSDFDNSQEVSITFFEKLSFRHKLASHLANSVAPVL